MEPMYLSIRPVETGKRIKQLLSEQNYTIREIQGVKLIVSDEKEEA